MAKVKKAVDAAVDAGRSVKSALNDILDMSTEARKARAAEQGFDVDNPVYRGSFSDEVEARPYVHTSEDITTANSYAGDLSHLGIKDLPLLNVEGANVSKYYTSPGRVATREDIKRIAPDAATAQAAFPALKEAGFNSFNDGYQVVVFDPKNIRSVNATFDPAKRESANLLAGLGGAAVLGASVEDAEASFGGVLAKNADALMLSLAEEMKRLGKPRDEIWRKTGWMEGPDNKWRFEIDDSGMAAKPKSEWSWGNQEDFSFNGGALGGVDDFISHPELGKNYDGLVGFGDSNQRTSMKIQNLPGGEYNPEIDSLRVPGEMVDGEWMADKSISSHELQHAIQEREGFAKGGSPADFKQQKDAELARDALSWSREIRKMRELMPNADISAVENAVVKQYQDMGAMDWLPSREARDLGVQPYMLFPEHYPNGGRKDAEELVSLYGLDKAVTPKSDRDLYQRLAGEAEARNVQTRLNMTPDERRATPPWETLDVPESEQIVRMKGMADPMSLAITAAITGAATEFYRRRESKQSFWQQRREELSELINAGDEFIRPAMPYINSALEALDKPMQGYYGVASALGALVEGNGLDASLQRGATVARQPIEETAQEYGGVLADEGYPLAGTALNTAMQVTGPF